jgi:2-polyprenyl-6-hydroxyphenyl methylase/3-demethylubiquinone-9 3-methyltransferase
MEVAVNLEQAEYDRRWAGSSGGKYSGEQQGYTPAFLRFMDNWLAEIPAGGAVLEVGCGDGFFSSKIAGGGFKITGIDLSSEGIQHAQQRTPAGTFLVHDLTLPLPFPDHCFDAIWCSDVLEHLFSPLFVFQQMARVLKPGGFALLTVPYHGLMKTFAIAAFCFERHYDSEYPHLRFFTVRSLGGLVKKAGLKVQECSTCGSQLGRVRDTLFPTNILLAAQR